MTQSIHATADHASGWVGGGEASAAERARVLHRDRDELAATIGTTRSRADSQRDQAARHRAKADELARDPDRRAEELRLADICQEEGTRLDLVADDDERKLGELEHVLGEAETVAAKDTAVEASIANAHAAARHYRETTAETRKRWLDEKRPAAEEALARWQELTDEDGSPEGWRDEPVPAAEDERGILFEVEPWQPATVAKERASEAAERSRQRFNAEVARLVRDGRAGIPPESQGGLPDVVAEARRQLDAEIAAHRSRIEAAGKDPDAAMRHGGGVVVKDDRDQPRLSQARAAIRGRDDDGE